MLDLFFQGFLSENFVLMNTLGLALFVCMPYTLRETLHFSLRFSLFLFLMAALGLLCRPLFKGLSPVFFLSFMAGALGFLSLLLNLALPFTAFEPNLNGLIRRGDPLVFLCFSAILEKNLLPAESFIFTLGGIFGVSILLILMAAFLEAFNLHRLGPLRSAAWRMGVLAVLSFLIS